MKNRFSLVCACVLLVAGRAMAHEFWIQPSTFTPAVGETVGVQLRVGDGFPGEVRPRDPKKLVRLFIVGPGVERESAGAEQAIAAGQREIPGVDGQDPAGSVKVERAGAHLLAYRSTGSLLTLEAGKFEKYLAEEGLGHVVGERARLGESALVGRERYSRAAKCLVRAAGAEGGTGDRSAADKPVGFPAEITPVGCDPTIAVVGTELTFAVTHEGAPAAERLVMAFYRDDPKHIIKLQTDREGRVRFTPDRAGMWMLGNVMMKRADGDAAVQWESVWASLTFSIAAKVNEVKR
jgi:uncharacterized GH25 family protein